MFYALSLQNVTQEIESHVDYHINKYIAKSSANYYVNKYIAKIDKKS